MTIITDMSDDDQKRLREVAAEIRSEDLVRALRHALNGEPHWRFEARILLELIDAGVVEQEAYA